jgi:uncharacterized protein
MMTGGGTSTIAAIVAAAAGLYLFLVALLALAQTWLIFPSWMVPSLQAELPPDAERVTLQVETGDLVGLRLPPAGGDHRTLIAFGGNAWNADALALYLRSIFPEREIVAFHYRGYGPSAGRTSAAALLKDALAIHDAIAAARNEPRIIAIGLSIGAGPAAHLAAERPLDGLVLITPFDTLRALARQHYPWVPVGALLRHEMDVAGALSRTTAPVAIITAARDTIIPAERSAAVRNAARNLVLDRSLNGLDHNDIYGTQHFEDVLREAVARIERARAPPATE